ncbi:ABC-type methionine transport system, permease component [Quadrisphaera granulorum]|uniref:ABC-type methionine transport system permease subunit n=1 Tax=Quadrisphaera granulorum TaxID=317664 RepID=A0A315ZZD2_9ACTN|nr:methionine ABC transporter permease [Quadrisphaera granulorum]PWJ50693.1 ABC-type methionine transport system permease subunit [Quadrisphaera granulorum]SZE97941.1 ABC-type methionine transport system, permease component [Quadrisphaera granulorum]
MSTHVLASPVLTATSTDLTWAEIPALVLPALGDTLVMVGVTMAIVVALGVPLGVSLDTLGPGGLTPRPVLHRVISAVVSVGRSLPFLILMAALVPFTRFVTGTNIGIPAAVVPMALAGTAFFSRIVENSLRSVPPSLVRVARASGASPLQVLTSVKLSEAVPSILGGLTINTIAMIEYSAIAGTIGAGGIGYVAVTYGYQRFDHNVMITTIVVLVALVAVVQALGDAAVRATTPHSRRRVPRQRRAGTSGATPSSSSPTVQTSASASPKELTDVHH